MMVVYWLILFLSCVCRRTDARRFNCALMNESECVWRNGHDCVILLGDKHKTVVNESYYGWHEAVGHSFYYRYLAWRWNVFVDTNGSLSWFVARFDSRQYAKKATFDVFEAKDEQKSQKLNKPKKSWSRRSWRSCWSFTEVETSPTRTLQFSTSV